MQRQYTPAERAAAFWAKVDREGPIPAHRPDIGPCWLWIASVNNHGYGKFWQRENGSRLMLSHVWAYEQECGPVPSGLELDHLCRTPLCIRPSHQEAVSHQENILRGKRRDACPNGHSYSGTNVIQSAGDSPRCRICRQAADRLRRPSRKLLAARAG